MRLSANKSLLRGLSLRFYGLYVTELSTDCKSQTRKIVVLLRSRVCCLCGILSCASPVKLQTKLHSSGVGLNVGDLAKLATKLMHEIR